MPAQATRMSTCPNRSERRLEERFDRAAITDVTAHGQRLTSTRCDFGGDVTSRSLVEVRNHYGGPVLCEAPHGRGADAAATARDDRDTIFEAHGKLLDQG